MKYRGFCDAPADDRGVYVEANNHEEAKQKMIAVIQLIYGCSADDISLYNIDSEIENPEGVLEFECSWAGGKAQDWDEDPIILFGSSKDALRNWANKPILINQNG